MLLALERIPMTNVLLTRTISAVAMAVPALAAVHIGYPVFDILVGVAGCILAWEWWRLWNAEVTSGVLLTLFVLAATIATGMSRPDIAISVLFAGTIVVFAVSRGHAWVSAGVIYIGLPCAALIWLRNAPVTGRETIYWVFGLVWASDIGAYALGRLIGGPKLAPRVSPGKTWAGLLGAIVFAGAVGTVTAKMVNVDGMWLLVVFSAGLGIVAQGGDLLESWFKRRIGVKDASALIPGHGGLLDRVDALIPVVIVTALISNFGNCSILRCL